MRFAFFRMRNDGPGSIPCSANYLNFEGFGGIRTEINNPGLVKPAFSHSPLLRAFPYVQRRRSMSPRMIEVDDMGGDIQPNSGCRGTGADEIDMNDVGTSVGSADCLMVDQAAAGGSREPFDVGDLRPICDCGKTTAVEPLLAANSFKRQVANTHFQPGPCHPLPGVQDLLNHAPPFRNSQNPTDHQHYYQEQVYKGVQSPTPTPSNSPMRSRFSDISFSAIKAPQTSTTEQYTLITNLYFTCLDASAAYINTLHSVPHRRHRTRQTQSSRYQPYMPTKIRSGNCNINKDPTLMDNISTISTHLWREARHKIMAPHRAEADTVRVMRDLYAWGEVVVRGMESGGDYEDEDDERTTVPGLEAEGVVRIAQAARLFCRWLADWEAWAVCKGTEERLGELEAVKDRSDDRDIHGIL